MKRIGHAASEENSFENVHDGRTPDACIYYELTYEPSAQLSQKSRKMTTKNVVCIAYGTISDTKILISEVF